MLFYENNNNGFFRLDMNFISSTKRILHLFDYVMMFKFSCQYMQMKWSPFREFIVETLCTQNISKIHKWKKRKPINIYLSKSSECDAYKAKKKKHWRLWFVTNHLFAILQLYLDLKQKLCKMSMAIVTAWERRNKLFIIDWAEHIIESIWNILCL